MSKLFPAEKPYKESAAECRKFREVDNDTVITGNTGVATTKASNVNRANMSETQSDETRSSILIATEKALDGICEAVSNNQKAKILYCFCLFSTLLEYVEPESIAGDANNLLRLSNGGLSTDELKTKVGHLFKTYTQTDKKLPEEHYPEPYEVLNDIAPKRRFRVRLSRKRKYTPRLTIMVKHFKKQLLATISCECRIVDILLGLLMDRCNTQPVGAVDEVAVAVKAETREMIPLDEVAVAVTEGASSGVGAREFYYQNAIEHTELCRIMPHLERFLASLEGLEDSPRPTVSTSYDVKFPRPATNQGTGESGGVSTLTKSQLDDDNAGDA